MENIIFIDDENIPPVAHHDKDHDDNLNDDYNDYKAPHFTDKETHLQHLALPTNNQHKLYGLHKKSNEKS